VYLADVYGENDFVQRLAVKLLSEEVSEFPDLVARQRDEARLLAQLNHDHIVKVMDLTEIGGRPAILMEYVDGIDANHLFKRVRFPLRAALEAIAAAASALAAAYGTVSPRTGRALHAIHRDIKPSNLLVSAHGGLKVLDFGVARANFDREGATQSVQFGTPRFMAPEQWLRGDVGPEVDVYALALTFLSLVTGKEHERLPLDPVRYEEAKRNLLAELPPLPLLVDVVDRMLAFEPRQRPSAAVVDEIFTALAEEDRGEGLERFARRVVPSLVAERRERWAADSPPVLGTSSATSLRSTAVLPPRRPLLVRALRFASAALAVFLLAAIALAVGIAFQESRETAEPATALVARPDPEVTSAPVEVDPPAAAPPATESVTTMSAPPAPRSKPAPVEAAALPAIVEPPAERASPTHDITVSSLPLGAFRVYVDDVDRGVTPAMKLELPEGRHTLVLVAHDGARTPPKTITVAKFAPTHWTWNTQTERWDY
jgi:hypothetical protein